MIHKTKHIQIECEKWQNLLVGALCWVIQSFLGCVRNRNALCRLKFRQSMKAIIKVQFCSKSILSHRLRMDVVFKPAVRCRWKTFPFSIAKRINDSRRVACQWQNKIFIPNNNNNKEKNEEKRHSCCDYNDKKNENKIITNWVKIGEVPSQHKRLTKKISWSNRWICNRHVN